MARFELTALVGPRVGGLLRVPGIDLPLDVRDSVAWTGEATWRVGARLKLGLQVSRQTTSLRDQETATDLADVVLEAQQLTAWLETAAGRVRPEIGMSVGRTRFGLTGESEDDFHPSAGFALGLRVGLADALDLVTRGRLIATLVGGQSRILCGNGGAPCLRTSNDTVLLQLQLSAGLGLRF